LKDYVIAKFEELKNKLNTLENTIEDYKEAKTTEKNVHLNTNYLILLSLKIFFQRKQWTLKFNSITKTPKS